MRQVWVCDLCRADYLTKEEAEACERKHAEEAQEWKVEAFVEAPGRLMVVIRKGNLRVRLMGPNQHREMVGGE